VREVADATVRLRLGGHAGELADLRAAAVGGHDQRSLDLASGAVLAMGDQAGRAG
jgi:hypothetical protein